MEQKKALATTKKEDTSLATFAEVKGMADAFMKSGMFTDVKQISQAIVKIQAGKELGLPPVYSMQNINMIRNRLTTSANTMAMLVKKSGNYDYRIKEHTDKVCTLVFYQREGDKWTEVGDSSFSMEDAKRAGLIRPDSGWEKYPRAMLFSRAISQGARIYAPDAIGGVYTDEEIRSIPDRPKDDSPAGEEATTKTTEQAPDAKPLPGSTKATTVPVKEQSNGNVSKEDIEQAKEDVDKMWPEDPIHAKEAAVKEAGGIPKTAEALYDWVAKTLKWKNSDSARSWIVNRCKIEEAKIDSDPEGCFHEIKELQGW